MVQPARMPHISSAHSITQPTPQQGAAAPCWGAEQGRRGHRRRAQQHPARPTSLQGPPSKAVQRSARCRRVLSTGYYLQLSPCSKGRPAPATGRRRAPPPTGPGRRSRAPLGAVLSSTDGLARTLSLTFYDRDRTAKDFLQSNRFNKSMPNTHGSRSHHNRSIGQSAEFKSSTRARQMLLTHVEEFDTLLNEL